MPAHADSDMSRHQAKRKRSRKRERERERRGREYVRENRIRYAVFTLAISYRFSLFP